MGSRRNLLKIGAISAVSFVITACTKAVSGSSEPTSAPAVEDTQTPSTPEQTPSQGGEVVIAQVSALVAGDLISLQMMEQMQFCLKQKMKKFMPFQEFVLTKVVLLILI